MGEFEPAAYDKGILHAVRALFEGTANEGQQKRFIEWLFVEVCHANMSSVRTDPILMAFLEGQRSVGLQIANLRKPEALNPLNPVKIVEAKRGKRQPNE